MPPKHFEQVFGYEDNKGINHLKQPKPELFYLEHLKVFDNQNCSHFQPKNFL